MFIPFRSHRPRGNARPAFVGWLLLFLGLAVTLSRAGAADSIVIFNELQYHPANEATQTEWIELRSLQGVDVDIGGWRIEGGVDYTFADGTIMPGGGYLVIAAIPGQIPGALGPFTGILDNGGETLRLVNRNGRVMDELNYDDENDWPTGPDGSGATLARRTGSAASGPAQWAASLDVGGTPGAKNFAEASDPPTVTTLIPLSTSWKYRDNNVAQAANWTAINFDETGWSSGNALLYAGSPNVTGAGEGLYGYWPLEETAGTVAPNLASGGTAGALAGGATWVNDGTRGKVLNFDGSTGYVDAGTLPQMTVSNNFTWSFWANSQQIGGNVILGNRYSPTGGEWTPREFIKFTSDKLQYDHNLVEVIDYTDFPVGTWVHHALVKQGSTFTYYRNGVVGGTLTISVGQNNGQPFYFGGDKAAERWGGRLDDIAVWTKALPASAITSLANGTVTPLTAPTGSTAVPLTTAAALGPTTHYFRKTFTFSGAKERTTLALQHILDDGAVVYLNGSEVLRVNMLGGAIAHSTPASSNITSSALSSSVPIPVDALVSGTNVLAVEVHQHPSNADMVFGATLVASEAPAVLSNQGSFVFNEISGASDAGFFVELQNTTAAAMNTSGWVLGTSAGASFTLPAQAVSAGGLVSFTAASLGLTPVDGLKLFLYAPGGTSFRDARAITNRPRGLTADGRWGHPTTPTPGATNIVAVSNAIVINEIFYHGPGTSLEQWVELYNRSGAPVDVSGWKFSDGITYQFPAGTAAIPANGYAVIAWDPAAMATIHPGVTAFGPFTGSLSGKGELLTLRDANDNVVNQLTYSDGGRWSQWADGGGSSLELRDPNADNTKPEAWDSSDESGKTAWQNVSYSGLAVNPSTTSNDQILWNEFVMGMLSKGECLVDDISVKDLSAGSVELIQNGTFSGGTAAAWRITGTQKGVVVDDPTAPGNKVLKIISSGTTEHMNNHAETTLKNGASYVAIDTTHNYSISFRAKWLRGSNRLHTRLFFNRLARQTLLTMPTTGGTPGAVNSRRVANIGPTFEGLSHTPTVPAASAPATVSVKVADANGIGSVQLFTSVNGAAFTSVAMTAGSGGVYTGTVPAQAAGAIVQFYVQATDGLGAVSFFPAGGTASRAIIPWQDGKALLTLPSGVHPHNLRVLFTTADANEFYKAENVMSNGTIPCTVIWDEREVYYNASVRLKSSEHGRFDGNRVGFVVEFGDDEPFLGVHGAIGVDRSGGTSKGDHEILVKAASNVAGGIYAGEDDIIRLIGPVSNNGLTAFTGTTLVGSALLSKSRWDDEYLDGQWPGSGGAPMFKYDLCYILTQTIDPATRVVGALPENPKIPQSGGEHPGVNVVSLGADKEVYRWHWLIKNGHDDDDYTGVINMTTAVGQASGSGAFQTQTAQYVDVKGWLRACVPANLFGVQDNYLGVATGQHNTLVFFPVGGKATLIPWDLDYLAQSNSTASLETGGDLGKWLVFPVNRRTYYGHVLDILNRSFNSTFLTRWAQHYSKFSSEDITSELTFLNARAAYAMDKINGTNGQAAAIPFVAFARTSSSPVTVATPFATVSGVGWINIDEIRLQGSAQPLAVTWTSENAWTLQLPISAGTKTYTLVAYSNTGAQLGTTTVTVTGSGGIFPAGPGNLVISELNYNPPGSTDATEFIELLNTTGATLDLSGCHFDEEAGQGIAYTFAAGAQVSAGGRIIVARNRTAFLAAYPSASGQLAANQYDPSALDNSGETIVLYAASGLEIFRTTYNDNLGSTDGNGRTLVRVLSSTNPDPNGTAWRASTADGGTPGSSDAVPFTGSAAADLDQDGLKALLEYGFGTSDATSNAPPWTVTRDLSGNLLVTYPRVANADDVVLSIETTVDLATAFAPAAATLLGSTNSGNVITETWQIVPPPGVTHLFVHLKAALR